MNKLLLALLILGTGTAATARFTLLANQSRTTANQCRAESGRLVSQTEELAASAAELRAQVQTKRARLSEASATPSGSFGTASTLSGDSSRDTRRATPAELRRRFGIAWDNSPDYVLVSKAALKQMYLDGFDHKGAFTPTACAILALTPTERDTIEAALKRVEAEHADWVKAAIQRVEPAGDIVADYRLPANPTMAARVQTEGMALLLETVGAERAELVLGCSRAWQFEHGNLGATPIRFTVRRHPDGQQPPLWFLLEAEGGSRAAGVVRTGEFPDLLRPVFPGGWRDLAQRESFALPEGVE